MKIMITELIDEKQPIYHIYFDNLVNRFSNASLQIENENDDFAETIQAKKILNQLLAINVALDAATILENAKPNDRGMIYQYIDAINKVNYYATNEEYNGFRTSSAIVTGSNVSRSEPKMISLHMVQLIDQYIWKRNYADTIVDDEERLKYIYEMEALFHIQFLHIHPYGDGNGRTARILLMSNLLSNSIAPCVITKNIKTEYCDYIETSNVKALSDLFRKMSEKESNVISEIYWQLDEAGYIPSNYMSEEQEQKYKEIKENSKK